MRDRRQNPRFPVYQEVEFTSLDRELDQPVQTHTLDISEEGMGIVSPIPLEKGERLSLQMRRPGQEEVLATATVAFVRPEDDHWVAGIELSWVDSGELNPSSAMRPPAFWSFL